MSVVPLAPSICEKTNDRDKYSSYTISKFNKNIETEISSLHQNVTSLNSLKKNGIDRLSTENIIAAMHYASVTSSAEWTAHLKNTKVHFVTLIFRRKDSRLVDPIEIAFLERYAYMHRVNHRRGLYLIILFVISTTWYDYLSLSDDSFVDKEKDMLPEEKDLAFKLLLLLRYAYVIPIVLYTIRHTYKSNYTLSQTRTLVCNAVVLTFPIFYNIISRDYGVSWFCLMIMFIYNWTPIRFATNSTLCFLALLMYTAVVVAVGSEVYEVFYSLLFILLVSIPSYSKEYSLRMNFMGDIMMFSQHIELSVEEEHSRVLLASMLPETIVKQLKEGKKLIAEEYENVSILFAEVCDFDRITAELQPRHVIELLNVVFSTFDQLVDLHKAHKVETVGAVYMVCAGCPDRATNHADVTASLALELVRCIPKIQNDLAQFFWGETIGPQINVRVGLNSGFVIAGVVGIRNPRFKLFGNTVNVTSRMESTSEAGKIQLSSETHARLSDRFIMECRGEVNIKGKGKMLTYYLLGQKEGTPVVITPISAEVVPGLAERSHQLNKRSLIRTSGSLDSKISILPNEMKRQPSLKAIDSSLLRRKSCRPIVLRRSSQPQGTPQPVEKRSTEKESSFMEELFTQNNPSVEVIRRSNKHILAFGSDDGDDDGGGEYKNNIVEFPVRMTKRNVFFNILPGSLTDSFDRFETAYRKHHRDRWMRFFRFSVGLGILSKMLISAARIYAMADETTEEKQWDRMQFLFVMNFGISLPLGITYIVYSFSPTFAKWEQMSCTCMILVLTMMLFLESFGSRNHGYLSILTIYQCHFSGISFILRFAVGLLIMGIYLFTSLTDIALFVPSTVILHDAMDTWKITRNFVYLFTFFASQAWVVFQYEFYQRKNYHRLVNLNAQQDLVRKEQDKVMTLLHNLLPESIVHKLKSGPQSIIADHFDSVSILFTDMVQFTSFSSGISAQDLVAFLNDMYTRFDEITERHGVYKVEIIGDAYFVVGGCPVPSSDHAKQTLFAGLEMLLEVEKLQQKYGNVQIRIGIHTGPIVAGVVGIKDPRYHLFGETATIAQTLESTGVVGKIHVSETTMRSFQKTADSSLSFDFKEIINVGNAGNQLKTYTVAL